MIAGLLCSMSIVGHALAEESEADRSEAASTQPATVTATARRLSFYFTLVPGGSYTFPLPIMGYPVQVMASFSGHNYGIYVPSELVSTVINEDPVALQLTWISQNSDGTTLAGNSISGGPIATFVLGNAVMTAAPGVGTSAGSITIMQSASTIDRLHYCVTMIW